MSSFWQFFDSQMAIFRRVSCSHGHNVQVFCELFTFHPGDQHVRGIRPTRLLGLEITLPSWICNSLNIYIQSKKYTLDHRKRSYET